MSLCNSLFPQTQHASVSQMQHLGQIARPKKRSRSSSRALSSDTHTTTPPAKRQRHSNPIQYWAREGQWPSTFFDTPMMSSNVLARSRSVRRRASEQKLDTSSTVSSTAKDLTRDQKSAPYRHAQYEGALAERGVFMRTEPGNSGPDESSLKWVEELLSRSVTLPPGTLFEDEKFDLVCEEARTRNEARVVRDITPHLVPSPLTYQQLLGHRLLVESVDEGWNSSIPITKTRPQPDQATGFSRSAFSEEQLQRLSPYSGGLGDISFILGTHYMYFPFLSTEVKCGMEALTIADRQNAHTAGIAVRAVVSIFREVGREIELNRRILAFSMSHDNETVRLYGYYPVISGETELIYRHTIRKYDFTDRQGRERWMSYRFIANIYEYWVPPHHELICSAVNSLPLQQPVSSQHQSNIERSQDTDSVAPADVVTTNDSQMSLVRLPEQLTPATSLTMDQERIPKYKRPRGRK